MAKKGDIAIDTVMVIIVALISLSLMITFVGHKLPGAGKKAYCLSFFYLSESLGLQDIKSSGCVEYASVEMYTIEYRELKPESKSQNPFYPFASDEPEIIFPPEYGCVPEKELVANTVACWIKAQSGKMNKGFLCKEIILSKNCNATNITELNATQILVSESACSIIGNNDTVLLCGDADNINWKINSTNHDTNILIEYDADKKQVIVQ